MTVDSKFDATETGSVTVDVLDLSAFRHRRETDKNVTSTEQLSREFGDLLIERASRGSNLEMDAFAMLAAATCALVMLRKDGTITQERLDQHVEMMRKFAQKDGK